MNKTYDRQRTPPRRAAWEFYPTPPEATRALLSMEKFDGSIWEPACGNGAISKELETVGHKVVSTDLIQRDFGHGGHDFLKARKPLAKHIITNPPYGKYGLADAFIRKALTFTRETGGTVAMLLNLRSLCNPDRHKRWLNTPPSSIHALDEVICWPYGKPGNRNARIAKQQYFWAVWKPGKVIRPDFWWLSVKDFTG